MRINRKSPFTGKWHYAEVDITPEQIAAYEKGALLQNAFPNLDNEQREFFKTGYTPEDWRKIFGGKVSPNKDNYIEFTPGA